MRFDGFCLYVIAYGNEKGKRNDDELLYDDVRLRRFVFGVRHDGTRSRYGYQSDEL